jgi:hypothetical protein
VPEIHPQPLAENLTRSRTVAEFDRAEGESLRAFDALNEQIIGQNRVNLACRAGCSLCCSLRVDVLAHEVFLLAHHILTTFPPEEIGALVARLEAHEDKVLRLTPFEHATTNIRCAMLREDGCCGVYAARPRSCRRHHSQELAACQYTFDHPTDLETPAAHDRDLYRTLSEAMQQGIDAYAQLGFDLTVYELGTALAEALRDPSCWGRWRNGGAAFLYASVTPSG